MRVLYGHTREDELAVTGWTREQKDAFLDHQFGAQTEYYRQHMPAARWRIIVADGADAGLLRSLQQRAGDAGCVLSIHVERHNPARLLYERLGFRPAGGEGPVYQLMEWRPGGQEKIASIREPS
jgi:hypothetical protein